jgi:hypothetical protein
MSGKQKGGREVRKPKQAKAAKVPVTASLVEKATPPKRPK